MACKITFNSSASGRCFFEPFDAKNDINPRTALPGIRCYNAILGVLLELFGYVVKIKDIEGKVVYVNKISLQKWMARHGAITFDPKKFEASIKTICEKFRSDSKVKPPKPSISTVQAPNVEVVGPSKIEEPIIPVLKSNKLDFEFQGMANDGRSGDLIAKLKLTVQSGSVDINARDLLDNTMLHYAAWIGDVSVVQSLLDQGANPNAVSVQFFAKELCIGPGGASPLHIAVNQGHTKVVRVLCNSAQIDSRDGCGNTPLHYALECKEQNLEIIQLLLDKGADSEARNKGGKTPFGFPKKITKPTPEDFNRFEILE